MNERAPKTSQKKFYENEHLGKFEVVELQALNPADIHDEDRAFIHTASGNRYMLRHSRGRNNKLVIYNEQKGGFKAEDAHSFYTRKDSAIAEVGKPFNVLAITDEQKNTTSEWTSTAVTRIEVRRGIEAAIRNAVSRQTSGSWGTALAEAVAEQAGPRAVTSTDAPDVDPLKKFKKYNP